MAVIERDRGWKKIKLEMAKAHRKEVAVGILEGSVNPEGLSIAEYAMYNEFGTENVPARPANAMAFDENVGEINLDFQKQHEAIIEGRQTAQGALTVIGMRHAARVQNAITDRDILPRLAPSTVAAKKGSTKTLVDTGAMVNAVNISVRGRGQS